MEKKYSDATKKLFPDKLNSRHRTLMRLLISGKSLNDAAGTLGMNVPRASVVANSPLFVVEMERMQRELDGKFIEQEAFKQSDDPTRKVLSEGSEKAAETLVGVLNGENPTAAVSAAKDILDRTGYAKEDKIKAQILVEPSQGLIDMIARNKDGSDKQPKDTGDEGTPTE